MPYVNLEYKHSLEIETGIYSDTPSEQRICKVCTSLHVENEYHFC